MYSLSTILVWQLIGSTCRLHQRAIVVSSFEILPIFNQAGCCNQRLTSTTTRWAQVGHRGDDELARTHSLCGCHCRHSIGNPSHYLRLGRPLQVCNVFHVVSVPESLPGTGGGIQGIELSEFANSSVLYTCSRSMSDDEQITSLLLFSLNSVNITVPM